MKNDHNIDHKGTTTHRPHCRQDDQDIHAASSFNICTMGVTLCLDHTSNYNTIPPKSSHVIIAKLTIEQL
jgi:hypothetical protein